MALGKILRKRWPACAAAWILAPLIGGCMIDRIPFFPPWTFTQPPARPPLPHRPDFRSFLASLPKKQELSRRALATQGRETVCENQAVSARGLRAEAALSGPLVLSSDPGRFFVRFDVQAEEEPENPGLVVMLVIDTSCSMYKDGKLQHAVRSCQELLARLSDRDYLGLVEYSDRATVLVPPSPVGNRENRARLWEKIASLQAGGRTNLSEGLLVACQQLRSVRPTGFAAPPKQHLVLLSDGLANEGTIDAELLRELSLRMRGYGTTISTFGVGPYFDEQLLQGLADKGGGAYRFLQSSADILPAICEELMWLRQRVAVDAELQLVLADGVESQWLFGYSILGESPLLSIDLGAISFVAPKSPLLELKLPAGPTGRLPLLRYRLLFAEGCDGPPISSPWTSLVVERSSVASEVLAARNHDMVVWASVLEGLYAVQCALDCERMGMHDKALATLTRQREDLVALRSMTSENAKLQNMIDMIASFEARIGRLAENPISLPDDFARLCLLKDMHHACYSLPRGLSCRHCDMLGISGHE